MCRGTNGGQEFETRHVEPHGRARGTFQYTVGRNPEPELRARAGAPVEGLSTR